MDELWKISLVVWSLFALSILLLKYGIRCCFTIFFYYTGLTFIGRKFVPNKKNIYPTGVIWFVGIYFAVFAFTAQRYESQLDKSELRYNIFTTQVSAGARFSNERLMAILNTKLPVKPSISSPISIIKSFLDSRFSEQFFHSYNYTSASEFRSIVISEWKNKLEEADFSDAHIEYANFNCTNFNRANFINSKFQNAKFKRASLIAADFKDADLTNADFSSARLNGANLDGAIIEGSNFRYADLEAASLITKKAIKANFNRANLVKTDFRFANLTNADLGGANLRDAHFNDANLKGARLGGANFEGADFEGADLEEADLSDGNSYLIGYLIPKLEGTNYEDTICYSANFQLPNGDNRKPPTAEQLIMAKNICGVKHLSPEVIEKIKKYGCEIMLKERPNEWTKEFIKHKVKIILELNPNWEGSICCKGFCVTNVVSKIHSE